MSRVARGLVGDVGVDIVVVRCSGDGGVGGWGGGSREESGVGFVVRRGVWVCYLKYV